MAQFLLGLPTSGSFPINAVSKADAYYDALFVQDDWHARSNLTFNLGLRWEKATPTTESYNRQIVGFNPAAVNQVTQAAETAYAKSPSSLLPASQFLPTGGVLFATGSNRSAYTTSNKAFAPRVGIAWTPKALHNRTVIRSGLGIFYYNYGTVPPQPAGLQRIDFVCRHQQQLPDTGHYLKQSLSHGNPDARGQHSGRQYLFGPEHNLQ